VNAARLEEIVRPAHIRLERRERIAVRDADNGLRGQVEHAFGLVQADCALERPEVLDASVEYCAPLEIAAAKELRLGISVADEHGHVGALGQKLADQP